MSESTWVDVPVVGAARVPAPVVRYFDSVNLECWEAFSALWTGDSEVLQPGSRPRRGAEEIGAYFRRMFGSWSAHVDAPTRVLVAASVVTVEVAFTGTTAQGIPVAFNAVDIFDLEGTRIRRLTIWYDPSRVREALGLSPASTGSAPEPARAPAPKGEG